MKILIIISAFLVCISLEAQEKMPSSVRTDNVNIQQLGDKSVSIRMDLILPAKLKLSSNRMMTFTPLLRRNGQEAVLPSVYVYGRKRFILSKRKNRLPVDNNNVLIHRTNGKEQVIDYQATIPYQKWMQNSDMILEQNLCGCNNHQEEIGEQFLSQVLTAEPEVTMPAIAFCQPEAEAVKRRTLEGSAFIDFPVNKTTIYPNYRENPEELTKIDRTLNGFKAEDISHISIKGFASPEGDFANNTRLAKGRTQALKEYIMHKKQLNDPIFSIAWIAEDWEGFKRLTSESTLTNKEDILTIANSNAQPDEKERMLKQLNESYLYMSQNWFPALRHADYRIEYTVRPFTPEEARVMIKQDPTQLSLREMYDAAQLCAKGSEEYVNILKTAVRLYPDSPVANLNAAAMELEKGDIPAARKYMEKADMNRQEAKDNMQRIILLEKKGK